MYPIIDIMVAACSASFVILAGGIAALYGLDCYKSRKQIRKSAKKIVVEGDYTTKEPVAEQLA